MALQDSMLLTGDLTSEQEPTILDEVNGPFTVLKVGHHGSKYSSSRDFLDRVKPTWGILSSGKGNRYGHPTAEVMERLTQVGCRYLLTDKYGVITITSDGESISINNFLKN